MNIFPAPKDSLTNSQKALIASLLLLIILFGCWVELRSAFLSRPMTDLGVYLRAAYAVRTGEDIYSITDDNQWHYVYPPFFAIMLAPLADPPKGADRTGFLPYPFTVGFWYLLTMLLGIYGIHMLARALEENSEIRELRSLEWGSQQWWAIRLLPFLILMPAIGRSQMRGQTGLIIAFLLCGMAASILKGKRLQAGLWLSAAVSVKVIPAFLFLLPLWRRDWRMMVGGLIGLIVTLLVVPMLTIGQDKTFAAYKTFYQEVLLAGAKGEVNSSRGDELTCISCTDSNSPMTVLHNILNPQKTSRPRDAVPFVRDAHWLLAFLLTAVTLWAARTKVFNKRSLLISAVRSQPEEIIFLGCLAALMCIISPVFHPHYVSMLIPLVTAMLFVLWQRYGYSNEPFLWRCLFWFVAISHVLTAIGGPLWFLRDFGLVLLSTLALWAGGILLLRHRHGV